ncbi:hypothetical protein M2368_001348 [Arthrobacter sp. JUb119]|nr:hypothetical protein [Arthrobacter sp. JUb119]
MKPFEGAPVADASSEQQTLGIHLHGDPAKISAEALERVARSLHDLLKASSKVLLEESEEPSWVVSNLALSSITAGFMPRADWSEAGNQVIAKLANGLTELKDEGSAPEHWDTEMLRALRKVTKLDQFAGAEGVDIWVGNTENRVLIDAEFSRIVEQTLAQESKISRGSVTGHVVGWKDEGGSEVLTIQDESSRTRVPVRISSDAGLTIQQVAGSRLRISGDLKRNRDGKKISLVMRDFEVLPDREVVSVDLIKGLWADDEEWVDSVEFQRRLRDEE